MDAKISQNAKDLIRQRVASLASARKSPAIFKAQTIVLPKAKTDKVSNFLVVCILFISFVTLGIMFFMSPKGKDLLGDIFRNQTVIEREDKPIPVPEKSENYMPKDDAQQFISSVNQRLSNIEEELKVWKQRTWMLAVANNENSVLAEKMDAEFHKVSNRGFVKVDENWKLAPVPKHLPLTEDQKKQIGADPK